MITVQLADKALHTILRKQVEPKLPDIQFFKRPVTIEFQNILAQKPLFEANFKKHFETRSAELLAERLGKKPLNLLVEGQEDSVHLKLYQTADLQELLPHQFKSPFPTELAYFEATIGNTLTLHRCSLTEDKEKALGLARIFILVAYDTLNHLKAPAERIICTHEKVRRVKEMNPAVDAVRKQTSRGVYYYNPKVYDYLRPVQTVDRVSRQRIVRQPQERFFLKPEWDRKGHWRRIYDRQTGELKRKIWIEESHVVIPEEKLKVGRTLRISRF